MNHSSAAFLAGDEVAVEHVGEGIRRQVLGYGRALMVVRVEVDAGARGDIHSHTHTQVSYVESGEFLVSVDGEERLLGPGDSFYVASNLNHGALCMKPGVLLDVFSPMREDFLESGDDQ